MSFVYMFCMWMHCNVSNTNVSVVCEIKITHLLTYLLTYLLHYVTT